MHLFFVFFLSTRVHPAISAINSGIATCAELFNVNFIRGVVCLTVVLSL
nr:MAG TPA_asm: hypothetical protein [Caudoviricetes sp.]